jgi:hypothetical protein
MATVDIYLLTEEIIVRLTREMEFERVPTIGEFVRIDAGGLLPHEVTEVVHDTDGSSRVVLGVTKNGNGEYDLYENESDLRDDESELRKSGWTIESEVANKAHKNKR